jgi:hypothetical protein
MPTRGGWGLPLFAIFLAAFFLLLAVGTPGCGRPALESRAADAAVETVATPAPADANADVVVVAACPAGVAALDVCGCGCCGLTPMGQACYYPARGESVHGIPNPMPSAEGCANVGCAAGTRHLCCVDPGQMIPLGEIFYCAQDLATGLERYFVTRRDGAICTSFTLEGLTSPRDFPVATPDGFGISQGRRGRCDGVGATSAIGGLGEVRFAQGSGARRALDVHVVLFFDGGSGAGTAEATRLDVGDLEISGNPCPR